MVARIARDVLAIQVSTVASESAFSTDGRVIDSFRSSLIPKSVECLICLQSWLRGSYVSSLDDTPSIKDTELYEACEKEHIIDLEDTTQSVDKLSKTVDLCEDDSDENFEENEDDDDVGEESEEESS